MSDVLSEAVQGIDRYVDDECYTSLYTGDLRKRIIDVRNAMDDLRQELSVIPDERADKED